MNKMDERILVVNRDDLFDNESLTFQGVITDTDSVMDIMGRFETFFEVRRGDAEENPEWKQPIPYVVIKRGESVFLYKRLKAGGETRLHDQLSIGIGGHMNHVSDVGWSITLFNNMLRELHEEVRINNDGSFKQETLGLINDDSNDLSKNHIGILFVLEIPEEAEVTVRETDVLEGSWIRIRDLKKTPLFESLETWSQMVVPVLE